MRKVMVLFLIFVAWSLFGFDVFGDQFGIWSAENSPYNMVGQVTVPEGEILTIEPGVEVFAGSDIQLNVLGQLIAEGTQNDSIKFSYAGEGINWDGIRLEGTETSSFSFCSVSDAMDGINSVGAPVNISNCFLTNNIQAIHIFGIGYDPAPEVNVSNCVITNSQQNAIYIVENSNATVENCNISYSAMDETPRAAIMLSSQGGTNNPTILNNYIHHNVWQGISAWDVTGAGNINSLIKGNEIAFNLTGIYLNYAGGMVDSNYVHNNFVAGNPNSGAGIMVNGASSTPTFTRNEISGNFTAFYIIGGATPNLGDIDNASTLDDGLNYIHDNVDGSGNLWSVYNGSSSDIMAHNNRWDSQDADEIAITIFDSNDSGASGTVIFDPIFQPQLNPISNLSVETNTNGSLWSMTISFDAPEPELWEELEGYMLYINGETTAEISYGSPIILNNISPVLNITIGLTALYDLGESEIVEIVVTNLILNPPTNASYQIETDHVQLNWEEPAPGSVYSLENYKIYFEDEIFETTDTFYTLDGVENGQNYEVALTANYGDNNESDPISLEFIYTGTAGENSTAALVSDFNIYPNPFNPTAVISFQLSDINNGDAVEIEIYNVKGQRIHEFKIENLELKINSVIWHGKDDNGNPVSSGTYIFKLNSAGKTLAVKKAMLLK